jgi:hypothetical protein
MTMPRRLRKLPSIRTLAVVGVLGLALPAPVAMAQTSKDDSGAGAANQNKGDSAAGPANPGSVSGVIVEAPPRPDHPQIPPDKKAAYDAEVAKAEAWKSYRQGIPPLSDGTIGQSKDYPGLQNLLPQEQPAEGR